MIGLIILAILLVAAFLAVRRCRQGKGGFVCKAWHLLAQLDKKQEGTTSFGAGK